MSVRKIPAKRFKVEDGLAKIYADDECLDLIAAVPTDIITQIAVHMNADVLCQKHLHQATYWKVRYKLLKAKIKKKAAWQPMETAPKDGTEILLYEPKENDEHYIFSGAYRTEYDEGWQCLEYDAFSHDPTKWQLLPEPPKEK